MSASLPKISRRAERNRRYVVGINMMVVKLMPRFDAIEGKAMLTMLPSRGVVKDPIVVMSSTIHL